MKGGRGSLVHTLSMLFRAPFHAFLQLAHFFLFSAKVRLAYYIFVVMENVFLLLEKVWRNFSVKKSRFFAKNRVFSAEKHFFCGTKRTSVSLSARPFLLAHSALSAFYYSAHFLIIALVR